MPLDVDQLLVEFAEDLWGLGEQDPGDITFRISELPEIKRLLGFYKIASQLRRNADSVVQPGELIAPKIGAYRISKHLGSGGMGDVWLGERDDETVDYRVAIKCGNSVFNAFSKSRLISERRVLARLSHPNIARFIDAGVLDNGMPWLALEYVEGVSIADWCNRQDLELIDIVRLFVKVCRAVEHAHSCLVVHRDIKPSNVLVDQHGEPKLLDFGIAKMLNVTNNEQTVKVATPAYASPEQFRGEEISAASDIYSLGIVLFELLAGRLPDSRLKPSRTLTMLDLEREDSQHPSDALRRNPGTRDYAAEALEGDLDAVVGCCIRQRVNERYPSVSALIADLQNYFDGYPIAARPVTRWVQWTRFARRNRLAVGAISVAVLALAVGMVVSLTQKNIAARNALAFQQASEIAQRESATAKQQAQRAKRATEFIFSIFLQSDPMRRDARGAISLDEAFEQSLKRIDTELQQDPILATDLNDDFGEILAGKGRLDEAKLRFEKALALAEKAYGPNALPVAESLVNLGVLAGMLGRAADGKPQLERAIKIMQSHPEADPLALANAQSALANVIANDGEVQQATRLYQSVLEIYQQHLPETDPRLAIAFFNAGAILQASSRWMEAEPLVQKSLRLAEQFHGPNSAAIEPMLSRVMDSLVVKGEAQAAAQLAKRRVDILRTVYPMDSNRKADAWAEAGLVLGRVEPTNGAALMLDGIKIKQRLQAEDEYYGWRYWMMLRFEQADWEGIIANHQAVHQTCKKTDNLRTDLCLEVDAMLAFAQSQTGRLNQADRTATEVIDAIKNEGLGFHRAMSVARAAKAEVMRREGKVESANQEYQAVIQLLTSKYSEQFPLTRVLVERSNASPQIASPSGTPSNLAVR